MEEARWAGPSLPYGGMNARDCSVLLTKNSRRKLDVRFLEREGNAVKEWFN